MSTRAILQATDDVIAAEAAALKDDAAMMNWQLLALKAETEELRRENARLREALTTVADSLSKAPKFAAVEYSDELLIPYSDIEKYARSFLPVGDSPGIVCSRCSEKVGDGDVDGCRDPECPVSK